MRIIKSHNGNSYLLAGGSRLITFAPAGLASFLSKKTAVPADEKYYADKIEYISRLISQGSCNVKTVYRKLTKQDLYKALTDTRQLIFEVTESCNLKCHYCGYGDFYGNHRVRKNGSLGFEKFISVYEHMKNLWYKSGNRGCQSLRISFYGGEPLLNFDFIEKAVAYVRRNPIEGKEISFSMTTNGLLLDRHIGFLADNDFDVLVSLDGNERNNSYRVFPNGLESFNVLAAKLKDIQASYPSYFKRMINFNTVLHDRNSVEQASSFIYDTFGKIPMTNELNVFGIVREKREEFKRMFTSKSLGFNNIKDHVLRGKLIWGFPEVRDTERSIFHTGIFNYNTDYGGILADDYLCSPDAEKEIPTKTCIPFSRKVFVTANGKLYPCERIGEEIDFGYVDDKSVHINESVVDIYNSLFAKYVKHCRKCQKKETCSVCAVSDLKGYEICESKPDDTPSMEKTVTFIEENPSVFEKIEKNLLII